MAFSARLPTGRALAPLPITWDPAVLAWDPAVLVCVSVVIVAWPSEADCGAELRLSPHMLLLLPSLLLLLLLVPLMLPLLVLPLLLLLLLAVGL